VQGKSKNRFDFLYFAKIYRFLIAQHRAAENGTPERVILRKAAAKKPSRRDPAEKPCAQGAVKFTEKDCRTAHDVL